MVFFVVLSFASPYFLTTKNIMNVMSQVSSTALLAIGMTIVIITSGIDLSVGATLGLSGMIGCMVLMNTQNVLLGVVVILLVGMLVGPVNGFFIGYLQLPAFIVTLGTMQICRSLGLRDFQRQHRLQVPGGVQRLGQGQDRRLLPCVHPLLSLECLPFSSGSWAKPSMAGSCTPSAPTPNPPDLTGINVKFNVMMAYVISGLMCGLAAWIMTSRLMACDATYGDGMEMDAIAAAVIGGTSMSGGKGTLWGHHHRCVPGGLFAQRPQHFGSEPLLAGNCDRRGNRRGRAGGETVEAEG